MSIIIGYREEGNAYGDGEVNNDKVRCAMAIKENFLKEVKKGDLVELMIGVKEMTGIVVDLDLDTVKIRRDNGKEPVFSLDAISYYEIDDLESESVLIAKNTVKENEDDIKEIKETYSIVDRVKKIINQKEDSPLSNPPMPCVTPYSNMCQLVEEQENFSALQAISNSLDYAFDKLHESSPDDLKIQENIRKIKTLNRKSTGEMKKLINSFLASTYYRCGSESQAYSYAVDGNDSIVGFVLAKKLNEDASKFAARHYECDDEWHPYIIKDLILTMMANGNYSYLWKPIRGVITERKHKMLEYMAEMFAMSYPDYNSENTYYLGVIPFFNSYYGSGNITPLAYYKGEKYISEKSQRINFSKNELLNYGSELNTKEYTYLVVFQIGESNRAINIQILEDKYRTMSSGIVDSSLTSLSDEKQRNTEFITAPNMLMDESYFFFDDGGECVVDNFEREEDGFIYGVSGSVVNCEQKDIFRFAYISDFDQSFQTTLLNGDVRVDFSVFDSKTYNIIKTARKNMLLCYNCLGGRISNIVRIQPHITKNLIWHKGEITSIVTNQYERSLEIEHSFLHFLSILSDGCVNKRATEKETFEKTDVYFKSINCPDWSEMIIKKFAVEVRCPDEEVRIEYDIVKNSYFAYRNNTFYFDVVGSKSALEKNQGRTTKVYFSVDQSGTKLVASLDKTMFDSTSRRFDNREVIELNELGLSIDEGLVDLYVNAIDFGKMTLPKKVKLNSEGWPESPEQEKELLEYFVGKFMSAEQMFAATKLTQNMDFKDYNKIFESQGMKSENIIRLALARKAQEIAYDTNGNLDEYSYLYITILKKYSNDESIRLKSLYSLFLQDFRNRTDLAAETRNLSANKQVSRQMLCELFALNNADPRKVLSHIVSLDEQSLEYLMRIGILKNKEFCIQLVNSGKQIENLLDCDDFENAIKVLRRIYQEDKLRFGKILHQVDEDVIEKTAEVLDIMLQRFVFFCSDKDKERFESIANACKKIIGNSSATLLEREKSLLDGYAIVSQIYDEVQIHPTLEMTELFVSTNIVSSLKAIIESKLDELYKLEDFRPQIKCYPNVYECLGTERWIDFVVENGAYSQKNIQKAKEVILRFESLDLSNDSFQSEVNNLGDLEPGEQKNFKLKIDLSEWENDSFHLTWAVDFKCNVGFNAKNVLSVCHYDDSDIIEIQKKSVFDNIPKNGVENPYLVPASGNPLMDDNMFFGRVTEMKEIWDYIVDGEQMISGRTVVVYGQKKCGKTSLINQIINRVKGDEKISENTIIINFNNILQENGGTTGLENFDVNLYMNILDLMSNAIHDSHHDLKQIMNEQRVNIPDILENPKMAAASFARFIRKINSIDNRKHQVLLIMDEFTLLCTTIMDNLKAHPEYKGIPNFIKYLSNLGFVQIIIGHDAMMRALGSLGVINHTSEFAKKVEISALCEEDAIQLIRQPMYETFGRDLYNTPLGESGINYLLTLSGCSPSILMKLCDQVFKKFVSESEKPIVIKPEIENWINEYVNTLDRTMFDMLLTEDGDQANYFENLPTYKYLLHVAKKMDKATDNKCSSSDYCAELSAEENEMVRETLIDRQVLSETYGRVQIKMGLFPLYLKNRIGF